jgi:hypothetical protein
MFHEHESALGAAAHPRTTSRQLRGDSTNYNLAPSFPPSNDQEVHLQQIEVLFRAGRRREDAMLQVKSPQDFAAGITFILIGAAGIAFGFDLRMGTAARMGPGYFPMLLSGLIIAIGLVVAGRSLTLEGPPIERIHVRPVLFILAAILIAGFLLNMIGIALTAMVVALIAAYARRQVNLTETLILGAVMGLFSVVVFVYALQQPLPAWWGR